MSFERFLSHQIPQAEAARYFIGLKKFGSVQAPTEASIMAELGALPREEQLEILKEAGVSEEELGEVIKTAASGTERAHANLEAKHETFRHTGGERSGSLAGKALGAAAGGLAGHRIGGSFGSPGAHAAMTLGGAALGTHLGGKLGKDIGRGVDAAGHDKHAAAFKLALQEVNLEELAAQEEAGGAAQEQNEAAFFRQKAQEAQAQLEGAQQESMAAQQQIQQLQEQVAGNDAQMQQSMQQAQMTQQGALANVQQAHMVATQATQQAMQATDEALKNQQMAAAMRMALQEMRGNMMDVASRDPAPEVGAQLAGQGAETTPPAVPAPEETPPNNGPAGEAPAPGAAPGAPPPEGDESVQAPTASPESPPAAQPATDGGLKEAGLKEKAPYMAAGALLGGGATALGSQRGYGDLRQKVQQLEAAKGGGFSQALDLAKAKSMLAAGEMSEQHPVASTLAGGLVGAGMVGAAGPAIAKGGKELFGKLTG